MSGRTEPSVIANARKRAATLLRDLRSSEQERGGRAAGRFLVLPYYQAHSVADVLRLAERITRRQALQVIAIESGYPTWDAFRAATSAVAEVVAPATVRPWRSDELGRKFAALEGEAEDALRELLADGPIDLLCAGDVLSFDAVGGFDGDYFVPVTLKCAEDGAVLIEGFECAVPYSGPTRRTGTWSASDLNASELLHLIDYAEMAKTTSDRLLGYARRAFPGAELRLLPPKIHERAAREDDFRLVTRTGGAERLYRIIELDDDAVFEPV